VEQRSIAEVGVINRSNYLLARNFLAYLRDVTQINPISAERYWAYMKHLLLWADHVPLSQSVEIRPAFAAYLTTGQQPVRSKVLAPLTMKKIFQTAKRFFTWARTTYPRDFRTVPASWIQALRLPRAPQTVTEHDFVKLEEVRELANLKVDASDLATQRDQATATMLFLSGIRASAFGSLTLACVDLVSRTIKQWPSLGVKTKNKKSATTYLLDIPDLSLVVAKWDARIRSLLPLTAPWYTPVTSQWGEQKLSADAPGQNRNTALGKRLRLLFAKAGLPYRSPHKFRHGHAVFSLQHAKTMADYKAVSMNLMHNDIRVTDSIYAPLARDEVKERIADLTGPTSANQVVAGPQGPDRNHLTDDELLSTLAQRLKSGGR
jgi:integrase